MYNCSAMHMNTLVEEKAKKTWSLLAKEDTEGQYKEFLRGEIE